MEVKNNKNSDSNYVKIGFGVWISLSILVCFWFFRKFAVRRSQFQANLHVIEDGLKRMQENMEKKCQNSMGYVDDVEDISDFMRKFNEAGDQQKVQQAIIRLPKHLISRKFCCSESEVITYEKNDNAVITLNRPDVHNCINQSLAYALYESLKKFENKSVVVIKGAGDSFCSGGDLKWILQAFQNNPHHSTMLMYHNANILTIATHPSTCVALIDGITMGGGLGLSKFCKYQVATERTKLAMPETLIGFHPNSAGAYFFTRMRGRLGWYLALTGRTLKGSDAVRAGLATHYCQSDRLRDLERELVNSSSSEVENILSAFTEQNLPDFSLKDEIERIDECFSASSVEDIFTNLERTGSKETLAWLKQLSPTSLKVTFRQLQKGENMSLKECLNMDYSISTNFLHSHDFPEGVRAKLIDKGEKPRWLYSTVSEVPEDIVNRHFETHPGEKIQRQMLEPMGDLL